jgi:signal transduction histidine kinase/CheY-like chemotaxis protein
MGKTSIFDQNYSLERQSIKRIAFNALGLLIIIPFAGVLYLFWDQVQSKWLPVLFLFLVALLGFFLVWTLVNAISRISRGLEQISQGKATSLNVGNSPDQLREMTDIINALNKLTFEFHENAHQLETFLQHFATLSELTEITAKIPDIHELLSLVLRKAMANTYSQRGSIMLTNDDRTFFEIAASEGWDTSHFDRIEIKGSLAAKVIESGEALLVSDLRQFPGLDAQQHSDRYSSTSFMIMPLKTKSGVIGVVCLSEKGGETSFSRHDQQFLTVLFGQIGYAIENARLLKQARDAADSLKKVVDTQEVKIKDAWEQLLRSEKLSALGQLIAGVAHELNNPLTSVIGYTGLVLDNLEDPKDNDSKDKVLHRLKTVLREANRASRIIQNLLSFARARKSERQMIQINDLIDNIVSLRRYDLRTNGIELPTVLDQQLPKVMLDPDQIQQVLLNLVNNAAQAMRKDGPHKITIGSRYDETHVYFWVEDTGTGIPDSIKAQIFEPFFTTKEGDSGTGLGLSITLGIIKEHGGEIDLVSELGKGTTMTIRLPIIYQSEASGSAEKQKEAVQPVVPDQKVLVVDDEEPIADLIAEFLMSVGYTVVVCTNGTEALQKIMSETFDLVISDVKIPDIDGFTIYGEVKKHRPNLTKRFILATGDITNQEIQQFGVTHSLQIIPKPFHKEYVLKTVFETLSAQHSQG